MGGRQYAKVASTHDDVNLSGAWLHCTKVDL